MLYVAANQASQVMCVKDKIVLLKDNDANDKTRTRSA